MSHDKCAVLQRSASLANALVCAPLTGLSEEPKCEATWHYAFEIAYGAIWRASVPSPADVMSIVLSNTVWDSLTLVATR